MLGRWVWRSGDRDAYASTSLGDPEAASAWHWDDPSGMALDVAAGADGYETAQRGGVLVVLDGTIDLDDELAHDWLHSNGQAEGACEAFHALGPRLFSMIRGDWSLCIVRPDRKRVYLARDCCGVKPLFVAQHPEGVHWGSSLADVARISRRNDETLTFDTTWLTSYVVGLPMKDRSPYGGVVPISPGSYLEISPGQIVCHPYWTPRLLDHGPIHPEEASRHFRQLLQRSVVSRMARAHVTVAELSGGLDSGGIVGIGSEALSTGRLIGDLRSVHYVFARSPSADEAEYVGAIERHHDRRAVHVDSLVGTADIATFDARTEVPSFSTPWTARHRHVLELAQKWGAHWLLCGHGGDHLVWSQVEGAMVASACLARRKLRGAMRSLGVIDSRSTESYFLESSYLQELKKVVGMTLLPARFFDRAVRPDLPDWIGPAVRDNLSAVTSRHGERRNMRGPYWRRMHLDAIDRTVSKASWLWNEGSRSVALSFPYLDRDLVDFCLGLSMECFVHGRTTRRLQREALAGIVPTEVLDRTSKASLSEPTIRVGLENASQIERLLMESHVVDLGLMTREGVSAAVRRLRRAEMSSINGIVEMVTLESWLRSARR